MPIESIWVKKKLSDLILSLEQNVNFLYYHCILTHRDLKHGEITHIQVYVDGVLLQDAQMCSNNPKGYNCRFTVSITL